MSEEIRLLKEILDNHDLDNYTIDDDECYLNGYSRRCLKKVLEEIERLNKRVKECEEAYLRTRHQYSELESKYVLSENVITELEEYIKSFLYMLNGITDRDVYEQCQLDDFTMIMEKLQELKGSDKKCKK